MINSAKPISSGARSLWFSLRSTHPTRWPDLPSYATFIGMESSPAQSLPKEYLSELERKFFWWEPVGSQPRSDARIVAQAMSMAGFEDVRRLEQLIGYERLAETMLQAGPGWIDERSWEFWRGRLMEASGCRIPDAAPVRVFDAGSV
jgi:hypothetical protein